MSQTTFLWPSTSAKAFFRAANTLQRDGQLWRLMGAQSCVQHQSSLTPRHSECRVHWQYISCQHHLEWHPCLVSFSPKWLLKADQRIVTFLHQKKRPAMRFCSMLWSYKIRHRTSILLVVQDRYYGLRLQYVELFTMKKSWASMDSFSSLPFSFILSIRLEGLVRNEALFVVCSYDLRN